MSSLIVHNLDKQLVQRLKEHHAVRSKGRGRASRDPATTLQPKHRCSLAEVLSSMPDVGVDADFQGREDTDAADVFD